MFWVVPFGFSLFFCSRNGFGSKSEGKPLENQSQPTPGPLRRFLLGLSLFRLFSFTCIGEMRIYSLGCSGPALGPSVLCFSYSACSGAPSPGLPLSLSLSSGLLWAPLAGSGPLLAREYSLGRSGSALGFLISQ